MSSIRIAGGELRRLSSGTLPKLAILAMVLVPLLYASLYLFANEDPYDRLSDLPAAVVTEDAGATDPDGQHRVLGEEVVDEILASETFDWHEVSAQQAEQGVRDDTYAFAITIPHDFSAALLATADFDPRQATITLTTNDANNYIASTIADEVAEQIREAITEQVGEQAADRFLLGFSTIHGAVSDAADGATELAGGAEELTTGQEQLSDGANELAEGSEELAAGLRTLQSETEELPGATAELADGAEQVADGNRQIAQLGDELAALSDELAAGLDEAGEELAERLREEGMAEEEIDRILAVLGEVREPVDEAHGAVREASGHLDELADGSREVADGARQLARSSPQLHSGIAEASTGAGELASGAAELAAGQREANSGTRELADGAGELSTALRDGLGQIPDPDEDERHATASTIANPVGIDSHSMAAAGSYGAGLAPYFMALAAWVGAFVMFLLLRPLSVRALAGGAAPARVALGGWLPSAVLGVAQMVVLLAVVSLLVGIDVAHPVGAMAFLILTTVAFTAVVHALNAYFGSVGKFLALVVLVLQLVTAGGTFPWQTIPDVLQPLHHILPMTYVVEGLRELLYTGATADVATNVAVLLAYTVGGLLLSYAAARKRRVWTVSKLKPELAL
ncbi:YhgE/Pip domain-containing protein [Haloechinothrix sp. LS1_15]|uniref:YhgE/Pip domain-containing protein n=1 Tax=Haloechinothrix sp. LS1_15 TaxID=2652248 RepID=UPI002947A31B|nr:YhgE/Pip domain-containing protein [Haloechinothrix sp. LS1_15]MDV6012236.1 YhgE/Pip domain-containing protein [Haloechinothrix sp. LS1_15]